MTRRAVLADIRPLPVVPTVRPADREGRPALVTAPTDADRHAWAVAAKHSMLQVNEPRPRASFAPLAYTAFALVLAFCFLAMVGHFVAEKAEPVRHELRIPR